MYKPMHISLVLFFLISSIHLSGCEQAELPPELAGLDDSSKPASSHTARENEGILKQLPFDSEADFEAATRGFIASIDGAVTRNADGGVVYSLEKMQFLDGAAPATVNPSLWRQAQLNALLHGLFKVGEGIYQVRSFDLANMTLIAGKTGWIIVDPLTTKETAANALALANRELGERPVRAVIVTHSHADHFGGVGGVVSPDQVADGSVAIIAPAGFQTEAFSENMRAGTVMERRSAYQFGSLLEPSAQGFVSTGLGNKLAAGTIALQEPTITIEAEGANLLLDGIEFEFMDVPGAEAPAELIFYLPASRALCMSEIATRTLHNLYTLRGAKTRDANLWASHINAALERWGTNSDLVFASHHWPTWGQAAVVSYLELQRDLYKYIHDQTLRLANQGYNMVEIAERVSLPPSLAQTFANRGYYGTVSHGVKAVYNYYLGWFDGNPSNLNPLPPEEAAVKYVHYMGGSSAILQRSAEDYASGEYRWVAEVLRQLVFAEPDNQPARYLLADAYEQLGYQAESGIWRNFYLSGALELRQGVNGKKSALAPSRELLAAISVRDLVDAMAVRLDGEAAADVDLSLSIKLTDSDDNWLLQVRNGVLHGFRNHSGADASALLVIAENDLKMMLTGLVGAPALIADDRLDLEGNPLTLIRFARLFDSFDPNFNIVTP
jgi:alkyl sulfatase BDS1-like metallo-beta-lactamase superfamily hydrolase